MRRKFFILSVMLIVSSMNVFVGCAKTDVQDAAQTLNNVSEAALTASEAAVSTDVSVTATTDTAIVENDSTVSSESATEVDSTQTEKVDNGADLIDAPQFTLPDGEGGTISLKDYQGKYVALSFFTTWCSYCEKEIPDLVKLQKMYPDDFVVIAVDSFAQESGATYADVMTYLDQFQFAGPRVIDEKGEMTNVYGVSGFPTTVFIDKKGRIIGGVPGAMELDQMIEIVDMIRSTY